MDRFIIASNIAGNSDKLNAVFATASTLKAQPILIGDVIGNLLTEDDVDAYVHAAPIVNGANILQRARSAEKLKRSKKRQHQIAGNHYAELMGTYDKKTKTLSPGVLETRARDVLTAMQDIAKNHGIAFRMLPDSWLAQKHGGKLLLGEAKVGSKSLGGIGISKNDGIRPATSLPWEFVTNLGKPTRLKDVKDLDFVLLNSMPTSLKGLKGKTTITVGERTSAYLIGSVPVFKESEDGFSLYELKDGKLVRTPLPYAGISTLNLETLTMKPAHGVVVEDGSARPIIKKVVNKQGFIRGKIIPAAFLTLFAAASAGAALEWDDTVRPYFEDGKSRAEEPVGEAVDYVTTTWNSWFGSSDEEQVAQAPAANTSEKPETTPEGPGPETTPEGTGPKPETTPEGPGPETTPEGTGPETTPEGTGPETTPEGTGPETTPEGTGPETTPEGTGPELKVLTYGASVGYENAATQQRVQAYINAFNALRKVEGKASLDYAEAQLYLAWTFSGDDDVVSESELEKEVQDLLTRVEELRKQSGKPYEQLGMQDSTELAPETVETTVKLTADQATRVQSLIDKYDPDMPYVGLQLHKLMEEDGTMSDEALGKFEERVERDYGK